MSRVRTVAVAVGFVAVAVGAFALGRFTAPQPQAVERAEVPKVEPVVAEPPPAPRMPPPTPPSGVAGVWTLQVVHSRNVQAADLAPITGVWPPVAPSDPVPHSALRVVGDATGQVVAETTTDDAGRFRVPLPPGRYRFEDPRHTGGAYWALHGHVFEVRPGEYTAYALAHSVVTP